MFRPKFEFIFRSSRGYMHMRIRRDPLNRDFQLSDFDRRYLTIPEMIHHYTRNRLPIKGAEHMCLKLPIAINLLWIFKDFESAKIIQAILIRVNLTLKELFANTRRNGYLSFIPIAEYRCLKQPIAINL
jgi:hypothetical protein